MPFISVIPVKIELDDQKTALQGLNTLSLQCPEATTSYLSDPFLARKSAPDTRK